VHGGDTARPDLASWPQGLEGVGGADSALGRKAGSLLGDTASLCPVCRRDLVALRWPLRECASLGCFHCPLDMGRALGMDGGVSVLGVKCPRSVHHPTAGMQDMERERSQDGVLDKVQPCADP
jgi:hypothetical protein